MGLLCDVRVVLQKVFLRLISMNRLLLLMDRLDRQGFDLLGPGSSSGQFTKTNDKDDLGWFQAPLIYPSRWPHSVPSRSIP